MPNQGVPVIFKNKVAYGYAEQSVKAYDVSVSDYNALTEQQQLDGSIRFIQGVDAVPNGNNVWAKLGTTPLAEGLPRDCSQAVNELKSNLTDKDLVLIATKTTISTSLSNFNLESDADDVDQYKELVMVIAWNANLVNYRLSTIIPTIALIGEYPTPYLVTSMGSMNVYCKFDTKRGGTIHWSNPPSGVSASRFDLFARK